MFFDHDTMLETIDCFPEIVFVVDQAYARYSVQPVLTEREALERSNVILLHSLTKQFAVPGLRIGYAVGPPRILDGLRAVRMPWSVNSTAIEAAHWLLAHSDDYQVDHNSVHREALRVSLCMKEMGIEVEPTDCNFVLALLPNRRASELKDWLIETHGLLIRDASNFEGLTPRHFRIAAQGHEENDLLINALGEWMSL